MSDWIDEIEGKARESMRILGVDMARPGSDRTAFVVGDRTMFYIALVYSGIPISQGVPPFRLPPDVEVHFLK